MLVAATKSAVRAALDEVPSLDDDRIGRTFLALVEATVRTSAYQGTPTTAFKFDPSRVPDLPDPRPAHEIFVCSSRVEGVHLRGGAIARGGLRWSDRPEDYRTEVLGLVKAQMVKNAVIVPVGAKGGFVVKRPKPTPAENRDEVVECYRMFVRGLLDLTDNVVDGEIVHPDRMVRYDGDDPYLVVAADKGTATFSDIANDVAAEYDFWLGDAFASGGSAGYDHKAMGITARGAWESVRRHATVLGKDADNDELTAVGIGDMSGDVFGNGMLLSKHLKLVAAFDHRHVFLDPDSRPGPFVRRTAASVRGTTIVVGRVRPIADLRRRRCVPPHREVDRDHTTSTDGARDRRKPAHPERADSGRAAGPGRSVVERRCRHLHQGNDRDRCPGRRPGQRCGAGRRRRVALPDRG